MTTMQSGDILRQIDRLFVVGTAAGLPDAQLLARYTARREEAAFAALVARHGSMVLAVCRGVLRDPHAVEDAFQATFLILVRRAGSLWVGESLGGWLHCVAHRVALQARADAARRRAREIKSSEAVPRAAHFGGPDDDLRARLHEEIGRLPERLRLPVVLCELEGLTRDQAAERLCWSEGTVRGRLARARAKLRERLTRRGVTLSAAAMAAALASEASAAPVPDLLLTATSRAAAGQGVTAFTAGVTAHIVHSMFLARVKAGAIAALAAGVVAWASAVLLAQGERPNPAVAPQAIPPAAQPSAPPEDDRDVSLEVRGSVLDPGGRLVAGATLWFGEPDTDDRRTPAATSGPDGQCHMRIPRSIPDSLMQNGDNDLFAVTGSAPGFGLGWAPPVSLKAATSGEMTVRLVEDGPPIEGRIVDLEGRPVAGAQVRVKQVWYAGDAHPPFAETGDLGPWITKVKGRGINVEGLLPLQTTITTTTGPDGRFRLTGIGRERVAEVVVSGPAIAPNRLYAMSRDGPEVHCFDFSAGKVKPIVVHASRFVDAVAPTQPIEGIIRDQDTGLPIAGLTLRAALFQEHDLTPAEGVEAITDKLGHYRLAGLPKAPAYRLLVEQSEGLPYPRSTFRAPDYDPTLEPVRFDITLKRAILVRGRVTDKATGNPVPGELNAFVFRDNPFIDTFPGFVVNNFAEDILIKEDGRYEAVVLPGRNIIACRSLRSRYRCGMGAETIEGYDPKRINFRTQPLDCYPRAWHVLAALNLDPGTESATLDLQVDPGRPLLVKAVDPEGNPIGGIHVRGVGDLDSGTTYPRESSTIAIYALDPSKPRRVTITHSGRKLIGSIYLEGTEAGSLTVQLQPWGTITGRIVDAGGKPRGGPGKPSADESPERFEVHGVLPGGDGDNHLAIGTDGRFRVEGLVPGIRYEASESRGLTRKGTLFQDLTVAPGETKDLGDLKVVADKDDPS